MKVILIQQDTTVETVDVDPDLAYLQAAVGGYIELLVAGDCCVWLNEEGKFTPGLVVNEIADVFVRVSGIGIAAHDRITGNVVVTGPSDSDGEPTEVPESVQRRVAAITRSLKGDPK